MGKGDTEKKEEAETKEAVVEEATADQLEAQWGGDDEIDIDMGDEILAETAKDGEEAKETDENQDSDIFVPPNAGPDPI